MPINDDLIYTKWQTVNHSGCEGRADETSSGANHQLFYYIMVPSVVSCPQWEVCWFRWTAWVFVLNPRATVFFTFLIHCNSLSCLTHPHMHTQRCTSVQTKLDLISNPQTQREDRKQTNAYFLCACQEKKKKKSSASCLSVKYFIKVFYLALYRA